MIRYVVSQCHFFKVNVWLYFKTIPRFTRKCVFQQNFPEKSTLPRLTCENLQQITLFE